MYTSRRSTCLLASPPFVTFLISVAQNEPQFAIDSGGGGAVDDLHLYWWLRSRGVLNHNRLRGAPDDGGDLGGDGVDDVLLGGGGGAALVLRRQQPLGGARLPLLLVAHERVDRLQVFGGAAAEAVRERLVRRRGVEGDHVARRLLQRPDEDRVVLAHLAARGLRGDSQLGKGGQGRGLCLAGPLELEPEFLKAVHENVIVELDEVSPLFAVRDGRRVGRLRRRGRRLRRGALAFLFIRCSGVWLGAEEHAPVDVAGRLRLRLVLPHDISEVPILADHLADDVKRAHEKLIEVAILHEVRMLHDRVLEGRPDFPLHVLVVDLQRVAQQIHAEVRQVVKLSEK